MLRALPMPLLFAVKHEKAIMADVSPENVDSWLAGLNIDQRKQYAAIKVRHDSEQLLIHQALFFYARDLAVVDPGVEGRDMVKKILVNTLCNIRESNVIRRLFLDATGDSININHILSMQEFIEKIDVGDIVNKISKKHAEEWLSYFKGIFSYYHAIAEVPYLEKPLSEISEENIIRQLFYQYQAKRNRLQACDWQPKDGVCKLMQVIEEKGPLTVYGFIGRHYYLSTGILPLTLNDTVKVSSFSYLALMRYPLTDHAHCVLLIGASVASYANLDTDHIYFIDPNLPEHKFALPYNKFVEKITDSRIAVNPCLFFKEKKREISIIRDVCFKPKPY